MATADAPKTYKNYINGEWVDEQWAKRLRIEIRRTRRIGRNVSVVHGGGRECSRWKRPGRPTKWRLVPAPRRAEILYRAAEMLVARKEELARDMTREMGKILAETRGDVQEAIDMTYLMAGEGRRLLWPDHAVGIA